MENNESNLRPQPTSGLKIMTVFVAVLALHVLVLGGFAIYSCLKKSNIDNDVAFDKSHKGAKIVADGTLPGDNSSTDGAAIDKPSNPMTDNGVTTPTTTDVTATPVSTPTIATANASASDTLQPKPGPAPLMVTPPPAEDNDASSLASGPTSETASGPIQSGPVINPPENLAPPADASSIASSTPSATEPADGANPVADGTPYTVKKGDSLARIAHRHHVALARLKTANSLTSDMLRIGQKLVIPNRAEKLAATDAGEAASSPQLSSADTDDSTTAPAASTVPVAPIATDSSMAATPAHLHKMSSGHHLYTVVKGDTLMKIARRYHTTASAIMVANNITNASRLSIGKKLHIPSGEARNAAASTREAAPSAPEPRSGAHGQLANYVPTN